MVLLKNNIVIGEYDSAEELNDALQKELKRDNEQFESNHYEIKTYGTDRRN